MFELQQTLISLIYLLQNIYHDKIAVQRYTIVDNDIALP